MKTIQLLSIAVAGLLTTTAAFSQPPHGPADRGERRAERKAWREKMEAQMKQQDAELDKLAQQINTASGPQKVDAIAAAVTRMIEQRKQMHSQMETMRQQMKGMGPWGAEGGPGGAGAEAPAPEQSPSSGATSQPTP